MKRRIIALFILLVAAGMTVSIVLMRSSWLDEVILNSLKGAARSQLGVRLELGSFSRDIFMTHFTLEDVTLSDISTGAQGLIKTRRLVVTLDPFAPLRGILKIKDIRLEGLDLEVVKNLEGRFSVKPLFPFWEREKKRKKGPAIPFGIVIDNVTLMDVDLSYSDLLSGVDFDLEKVLISITRGRFDPPDSRRISLTSKEGSFDWSAFPEGRSVSIDRLHIAFTFTPETVLISDFTLSSGPLDAKMSGSMPMKGGDLSGSLELEVDLEKFPWLLGEGRGTVGMTGDVAGSLKDPRFEGLLSGDRIILAGRRLGSVSADISLGTSGGTLKNLVVNYGGEPIMGEMKLGFSRGLPFTASVDIKQYSIGAMLGEIDARSNLLKGTVTARCRLSGYLTPSEAGGAVDLDLAGTARIPVAGSFERDFEFSLGGRLKDNVVTIGAMTARSGALLLEASGQLAADRIDMVLDMTELDMSTWQEILPLDGLTGELQVRGTLGGTLGTPVAKIDLTWQNAGALKYTADQVQASLLVDRKGVHTNLASLKMGSSSISIQGFMPWRPGSEKGWWILGTSGSSLDDLVRAAGLDLKASGKITMQVALSGIGKNWTSSVDAVVRNGSVIDEEFQELRVSARYDGEAFHFNQLDIVKSGVLVRGRGHIKDGSFRVEVISDAPVPLEEVNVLRKIRVPLSGGVSIKAIGTGDLDGKNIKINGSLQWDLIFYQGRSWRGGQSSFSINGRDLFMEGTLMGDLFQAAVQVNLGGEFSFSGTMKSTKRFFREDINDFLGLNIPPDYSGQMSADLRAEGFLADLDKTLVEGRILDARLDMKGLKFDTIGNTPFEYRPENGISFTRLNLLSGDSELSGNLRIGPPGVIEGSLEGEVDITGFRYLEPTFDDFVGRAALQLKLSGPLDAPEVSGFVDILEASCVAHLPFPQKMTDIAGRIDLLKNRMRVSMIRGVSDGGSVEMDGDITFEGLKPVKGRVSVRADSVPITFPEGLNSVVRAELVFRFSEGRGDLRGRVLMDEGGYKREIDIDNLLALLQEKSMFQWDDTDSGDGGGDWLSLDVEMETVKPLDVDIKLVRGVASGALRLHGTAARPILAGRLEMDSGVVIYRGHNFEVTQGSIGFFNPEKIEPNFDYSAKTQVSGFDREGRFRDYVVELTASGVPAKFKLELNSTPSLNQIDIISLLTWGVVGEEAFASRGGLTAVEVTLLLTKELKGRFESEVERLIGFDRFVIDPNAVSSTGKRQLRIKVDKKLGDRLALTMTTPVIAGEGQEVMLRYRVSDTFSLIGEQKSETDFGLDLDFQFEIK